MEKDPLLAGVLAWLVPGWGHYYLGLRTRAAIYAVCIIGMFVLGILLGQFENVQPKRHDWSFALQIFAGVPTFLTAVLVYNRPVPPGLGPVSDLGMSLTLIAAALNVFLIADAFTVAALRARARQK